MPAERWQPATGPKVSARLRLALTYSGFSVLSGMVTLAGVYLVLRFVPDYPLTEIGPRDTPFVIENRQQIIEALVQWLGLVLVSLALFGLAAGWIIAGWILRPLQRINEAAEIAASGRLDHRIQLTGRNDEFRQLADTFDHMLERLHDAFATQERFAANASHELRTPLTVTATMLDVARANPNGQDYEQLVERLRQTNDRAIGLTEALLRLSDANAIAAVSEHVDLAVLVKDALVEFADEAAQRGIEWTFDLRPGPVVGDPALLGQMVLNLVQNAIRHNVEGGAAVVSTGTHRSRTSVLRVENNGAGYTRADAARLTEPFLRGGGRVTQPGGQGGHGLGLALVDRIVALHHGSIDIAPREGGGLTVTVALPGVRVPAKAG